MPGKDGKTKIILVCGGRFAGMLYSIFRDDYDFIGYVDDLYPRAYIEETYGVKNLGESSDLRTLLALGAHAIIAVTDVTARAKYHDILADIGFSLATLISPTAIVSRDAVIGKGCIIRHNAVVSAQVRLADNVVVSDNAYVGHDSVVGKNVYVAPGANLNGCVIIGNDTFIGTGAIILPHVKVGRGCTIGAAACVTKDIADGVTVVGVPARPLSTPVPLSAFVQNEKRPEVSVIMASYNHEKYVGQAIESVLAQSFKDFEFIIIDDGSSDGTAGVIRRYNDPRIKAHFSAKNCGAIFTKNKCLDIARGRYIAILNSDDAFLPDKLEKQVDFLNGNPEFAAVFTDAAVIDDNGKPFQDQTHFYHNIFSQPNRSRYEWLRRFFYDGNCLCAPSALIRSDCYNEVGRPDSRFIQLPDLDLWIRICLRHDICVIQEKLTQFRVRANNGNASSGTREHRRRHVWECGKILHSYCSIASERELIAIFPEAARFSAGYPIEQEFIPFVIANLALSTGSRLMCAFALDVLYEVMEDAVRVQKLYERFGFGHKEFIDLTGKYDLYFQTTQEQPESLPALRQKIRSIFRIKPKSDS